jgi:hypothetical protein
VPSPCPLGDGRRPEVGSPYVPLAAYALSRGGVAVSPRTNLVTAITNCGQSPAKANQESGGSLRREP